METLIQGQDRSEHPETGHQMVLNRFCPTSEPSTELMINLRPILVLILVLVLVLMCDVFKSNWLWVLDPSVIFLFMKVHPAEPEPVLIVPLWMNLGRSDEKMILRHQNQTKLIISLGSHLMWATRTPAEPWQVLSSAEAPSCGPTRSDSNFWTRLILVLFVLSGLLQQTSQRFHQEDQEPDQTGPEHQLQTTVASTCRRWQVPPQTGLDVLREQKSFTNQNQGQHLELNYQNKSFIMIVEISFILIIEIKDSFWKLR